MLKTAAITAGLALGVSTFAIAQTSTPTPSAKPGAAASGSSSSPSASPSGAGSTSSSGGSLTSGSGASSSPRMSPADVKERLERDGYTEVSDVEQGANGFTATARKDGKQMSLEIDATGNVSPKKQQ